MCIQDAQGLGFTLIGVLGRDFCKLIFGTPIKNLFASSDMENSRLEVRYQPAHPTLHLLKIYKGNYITVITR